MPELAWSAFLFKHPRPHLIMGLYEPAEKLATSRPRGRSRVAVLRDLVRALEPAGDWATTMETGPDDAPWPVREVRAAFADWNDAVKLTGAVQARPTARHGGFASQHAFHYGSMTYTMIEQALAELRGD